MEHHPSRTAVILLALAAACYAATLNEEKKPFSYEDIFSIKPKGFSNSWVGDKLVLRRNGGDIVSHDPTTGTEFILVPKAKLDDLTGVYSYHASNDLSHVLISYDYLKKWRHSYDAKYKIFKVADKSWIDFPLNGSFTDRLQYARWAPTGNKLAFVYNYDIYTQDAPTSMPKQITTSGSNVMFNGVPDWLYEEDVLSTNVAHYWSPDSKYLVFAEFDLTYVPVISYPIYGKDTEIYPTNLDIPYPKAGDITADGKAGPNTKVTLYLCDVTAATVTLQPIKVPAGLRNIDHYYTRVGWMSDTQFLVTWTNRVQDEAHVESYTVSNVATSTNNYKQSEANGWIDAPWPKPHPIGSDYYATIIPEPVGDDKFNHIALMKDKTNITWIKGSNSTEEVMSLNGFHQATSTLFYISTGGDARNRHLYSISTTSPSSPKCITCSIKHNNEDCLYASATFSDSAEYYVLNCRGPGIPHYSLRSVKNDSYVVVLEDNAAYRAELNKRDLPTREFEEVTVAGGYSAIAEVFIPPGHKHGHKYKLVVYAYGGPGSMRVSQAFPMGSSTNNWLTYLKSSEKVVVASIDSRGASARGQKYRFEMYKRLGTVEVEDQIALATYLMSKDYVDESQKAAIFGWSYGGQTAAHSLAREKTSYHCALSVAPVTSKRYYDTAYTERYMRLATPGDNQAGYVTADVLNKVKWLKDEEKEFFLAHGTNDDNVHWQHAAQLIRVMTDEEIQFTQLAYIDENHSITSPHQSRHLYKAMTNFLKDDCWKEYIVSGAAKTQATSLMLLAVFAAILALFK